VEAYLRSGATGVIVGLDAGVLSVAEMDAQLQQLDEAVRQAVLTAPAAGNAVAGQTMYT
jgi:hypothetical protein